MKKIQVEANQAVCRKGDASHSMYLIESGLLGVYANYGKRESVELALLNKGKFFGEMGVIENMPRTADVVAIEDSVLIEIEAEDFPAFVRDNTADVIQMMQNLSGRLRATTVDLEKATKSVNSFVEENEENKAVDTAKVSGIASLYNKLFCLFSAKETAPKNSYEAGEVLFGQNEVGNCMFQILEGRIALYRAYGTKNEEKLAVLEKGAILGEMAVLEKARRSATAVAETPVKVETVVNAKLGHYLSSHPEEAMKILRGLSAKLRETTRVYVETLTTLSEYVEKERGSLAGVAGTENFDGLIAHFNAYDGAYTYSDFNDYFRNCWH